MGFAYIVKNSVPCFVCHMAEKIFFRYLTGFQNFQGTVCGGFGMLFQYHYPDSGQRTVEVMEPHGSHSIHIDFCVSHQFRKFFVGHHLAQQPGIDPSAFQKRHGIIGICGWGGMAVNAAAIDTRIKATAAMTMYDMTRVNAKGYFDSEDSEQARFEKRKALNTQRTEDYRNGSYALAGGVVDPLPEDAPQFVKDYYAYYKTPRGYHPRSLNSNGGWNVTFSLSFLNMPILQYSSEIRSAVLLVHGEKAHSRYFSETAYSKLTGDNKELLIIPGASHTDLYDQMDIIPFEKLKAFFGEYLK